MRFTRIVRTGLSITVSTPAIAAAWTRWVAPLTTSARNGASRTSPWTKLKFGCSASARAAERVAVQVVHCDDLVLVDEPTRERRADEARAARDDDALPGQSHAASLRPGRRTAAAKTIARRAATLASARPSPRGQPRYQSSASKIVSASGHEPERRQPRSRERDGHDEEHEVVKPEDRRADDARGERECERPPVTLGADRAARQASTSSAAAADRDENPGRASEEARAPRGSRTPSTSSPPRCPTDGGGDPDSPPGR